MAAWPIFKPLALSSRNLINIDRHVHFIGIGGVGMSGLALILLDRGFSVSGSDQQKKANLQKLISKGARIFFSQTAENIESIRTLTNGRKPLVVLSSAIDPNNPELIATKQAQIEIWHRSDLLAALIQEQEAIVVAGTHGKTTTSTIITTMLALAQKDPTAVIGGLVPHYNSNAHSGSAALLVAEADESDGTLVKFHPSIGLITNLELDHIDFYKNLEHMIQTFQIFCNQSKLIIANYDCPILQRYFNPDAWWSIKMSEKVDFAAIPVSIDGSQTIANFFEKGNYVGKISIPLPGLHNLSNTTAAIAACRIHGISFRELQNHIKRIKCPGRRFDYRGTWKGRHIVDDYAHHPTEIRETLSMARLMINSKKTDLPSCPDRLVVVFQPHRYTRTKKFMNAFSKSFSDADCVLLAPVYPAGEKYIEGANSVALSRQIKNINPDLEVLVAQNLNDLIKLTKEKTFKDDLILLMGAGDINCLWQKLNDQTNSFDPKLVA